MWAGRIWSFLFYLKKKKDSQPENNIYFSKTTKFEKLMGELEEKHLVATLSGNNIVFKATQRSFLPHINQFHQF